MALPSVVTLGSVAFVVVAGFGYAVTSTASAGGTGQAAPPVSRPTLPTPSKPITSPQHAGPPPAKHKPDVVPHVLVVVFNNTGISGLASQKAALLQGAGWNVAATDNWYGNIPADTVYYPAPLRADAAKLAKVLHIARLRPAIAPMQFDRLTVIFATG